MTEDYPKTVLEFERRFATDAACRAYLMALRWPEGFVCPRCGGCKAWPTVHDRWVCSASSHRDRRNDFSRHPSAFTALVPSHVVCHQPEKRGQRAGAATGVGIGWLPHGLELATQAAPSDGATRAGTVGRGSGGG